VVASEEAIEEAAAGRAALSRPTMTAMPAAQTMAADEFLALPMKGYGYAPCLVEGELVVNQPALLHQLVVDNVKDALRAWVRAQSGRGLVTGPLSIVLDSRNVYEPDVLWYAEEHRPADELAASYAMPGLAVEVRSPATWRCDIGAKKSGYEREGLPELWLVDTAADEVLVFRRSAPEVPRFDVALELESDAVLESPLLPGFALPVRHVFER
jgi:Uma2 family endonuclease